MIRSDSTDGPPTLGKRTSAVVVLVLVGGILTVAPAPATAQYEPEDGAPTEAKLARLLREDPS